MALETNRTLHVILATRLWQAGSGLITIVMIAHFLDTTQQGWYFSLLSLAAFYTLFDFGLSTALMQVAAPIFLQTHWGARGTAIGPLAERSNALTAWSVRYYTRLAIAFAVLIAPVGVAFFLQKPDPGISWHGPWLALAITSAAMMPFLPFLAIVEGSGEVREIYIVRLLQGVVGALAGWLTLIAGGELWAVVTAPLAAVVIQGIWLCWRRPALLGAARIGSYFSIDWRSEFWGHQRQLGIGLVGGYLLTQIYTPILFMTQNAVVAGQFGLTMTISNMLGLLALSWVTRHVPAMAKAVADGRRAEFDAICRRDLALSSLAFLGGAVALCSFHGVLEGSSYANRVLPFWPFVAVLASGLLGNIQIVIAAQLRSFRIEPLLWIWLASGVLTVAGAIWGTLLYSAAGVAVAMLVVQIVFAMPASLLKRQAVLRRLNRR